MARIFTANQNITPPDYPYTISLEWTGYYRSKRIEHKILSQKKHNLLRMINGPIYRQVIDLANLDNSRYIQSTGQSGHLLSPHYDDLLPL